MKITMRRTLALAISMLLVSQAAWGHRSQYALSTVSWNERTSSLEIVHRLHAHDLSVVLAGASGNADFDDLRNRARAVLYVAERFTLQADCSRQSAPTDVGAEVSGASLLIYQELECTSAPRTLTVASQVLSDAVPGQVNQVNIEVGRVRRSLRFEAGDGPRQVSLAPLTSRVQGAPRHA